jgi:AcrR family transcriptional regulator
MEKELKFRRRKTARPNEIVEAAMEVFAERGFAAARLDEIAVRAGVSKGTLYLYFETKEALFRAVVQSHVTPGLTQIRQYVETFEGSFEEFVTSLLTLAAERIASSRAPAVAKIVVGESKNFPDLARIWYAEVITPTMAVISEHIRRAQAKGEVKAGDPELYALSITAPVVMGMLFREIFGAIDVFSLDLSALAAQHSRLIAAGMVMAGTQHAKKKAKK